MTHRRQAPVLVGADTYRATGATFSQEWTGPWQELYDKMQALTASMAERLDATLTRQADGEYGTLRATWTYYEQGTGEGGEQPQQQPGSSRECPQYELSSSATQEPVLTHPKFAAVKWDTGPGIALQKLAAGADPDEEFEWLGTRYSVGEEAQKVDGWELVLRARSYYVPHVVVSVTRAGGGTASVGEVVSKVEGVATAAGVKWLTAGGGASGTGAGRRFVQKYIASGPGGWDKEIYSAT
jgi:hypothetical protein